MVRPFLSVLMAAVLAGTLVGGCKKESEAKKTPAPAKPATKKTSTERKPQMTAETKKQESNPKVAFETTKGTIIIELYADKAPVTVKNFLRYVEEGFYTGTIFHRVIPGFMIQGGGFTKDMQQKQPHEPIINEANNGVKNLRGVLSMARTNDPNSATSQFFISVKDNSNLDYAGARNPGYAAFAKVIEGMDVADKIVSVETTTIGDKQDVPVEPIVITEAKVVSE